MHRRSSGYRDMPPPRKFALALALAWASAGVAGCELKGDRVAEASADAELAAVEGWPFMPAAVRVHPFSVIHREGEAGVAELEAHIELVDQLGDVTKGVGEFRFELYTQAEASRRGSGDRQIERWEAPLTTLDHNRRHWDTITRTYVFRLRLQKKPPTDATLRLDVQFTDAAGKRMTTSATIGAK